MEVDKERTISKNKKKKYNMSKKDFDSNKGAHNKKRSRIRSKQQNKVK